MDSASARSRAVWRAPPGPRTVVTLPLLPRPGLTHQIFNAEMESFFLLFNRYLTEKAKGERM